MFDFGYAVGGFGDLRLEKGGPACMRLWLSGRVRVCVGWRERGRRKYGIIGFCETLK